MFEDGNVVGLVDGERTAAQQAALLMREARQFVEDLASGNGWEHRQGRAQFNSHVRGGGSGSTLLQIGNLELRVVLQGVEVLVSEQLLHVSEVRTGRLDRRGQAVRRS